MRRRRSFPKLRLVLASALALFVLLAAALSVHRYRQPVATPPEALAHIAEKNRDAAVAAAAHQKAEAAAATNAAENLAAARAGGRGEANAVLARGNGDNREAAAGNRN